MTAPSPTPARPDNGPRGPRPSTRALLRTGVVAGGVAAVTTTLLAAVAVAADVDLEVDATAIPVAAFAWWTVLGAALGVVLARVLPTRGVFVSVALALTALSLIPAVALPDDTAASVVLVAAHLVAAAIIIPALGRQMPPASAGDAVLGTR